jgi:hypothetical protein
MAGTHHPPPSPQPDHPRQAAPDRIEFSDGLSPSSPQPSRHPRWVGIELDVVGGEGQAQFNVKIQAARSEGSGDQSN